MQFVTHNCNSSFIIDEKYLPKTSLTGDGAEVANCGLEPAIVGVDAGVDARQAARPCATATPANHTHEISVVRYWAARVTLARIRSTVRGAKHGAVDVGSSSFVSCSAILGANNGYFKRRRTPSRNRGVFTNRGLPFWKTNSINVGVKFDRVDQFDKG